MKKIFLMSLALTFVLYGSAANMRPMKDNENGRYIPVTSSADLKNRNRSLKNDVFETKEAVSKAGTRILNPDQVTSINDFKNSMSDAQSNINNLMSGAMDTTKLTEIAGNLNDMAGQIENFASDFTNAATGKIVKGLSDVAGSLSEVANGLTDIANGALGNITNGVLGDALGGVVNEALGEALNSLSDLTSSFGGFGGGNKTMIVDAKFIPTDEWIRKEIYQMEIDTNNIHYYLNTHALDGLAVEALQIGGQVNNMTSLLQHTKDEVEEMRRRNEKKCLDLSVLLANIDAKILYIESNILKNKGK